MSNPRAFSTVPIRAIKDKGLGGVDHRVLQAVSMRDGMSQKTGKGAGCTATTATLRDDVGTDRKTLWRSIQKLIARGYLKSEERPNGKGQILRVIFLDDVGQLPPVPVGKTGFRVSQIAPQGGKNCGAIAPSAVGRGILEASETINEIGSTRNLLDSVKQSLLDSPKVPPSQANAATVVEKYDLELLQSEVRKALSCLPTGTAKELSTRSGVSQPYVSKARNGRLRIAAADAERLRHECHRIIRGEQGLGSGCQDDRPRQTCQVSLFQKLPTGFFDLNSSAQVPILDRKLKQVDWSAVPEIEREEITGLLQSIADKFSDCSTGQQAQRIYENIPYAAPGNKEPIYAQ